MIQEPIPLASSLALTFLGYYGISQAQTTNTQQANAQQPRWIVMCNNRASPERLNCSMTQVVTVANGNSRQRVISATIHQQGGESEILATLPHRLNLQDGVGFSIDDATPERFNIHTADANGSHTRIPLTKDRVSAMKKGATMNFNVVGQTGGNVKLQISLSGFTQAYNLMK